MKICIIKLGADGDVLRTLPLAKAIKKKYPNGEITWITKGDISTLLENIHYIHQVLTIPCSKDENFDLLYNFDVDKDATSLAMHMRADKKYGFYEEGGYPAAFNIGAEYYLNTMFDDEMKKKNRKTYQEMMFAAAEMPYERVSYQILLTPEDKHYCSHFVKTNKIVLGKVIGIHMGASSRWPSKVWHEECVKDFIIKAKRRGFEILLFGGPNEVEKHTTLSKELEQYHIHIYRNNPLNTKRQFAALVDLCQIIVCGDSLALHVALGLQKPTIGLFFCTPPWEVEKYGLLRTFQSPLLENFFPERMDVYDEPLVKSISAEEVLQGIAAISAS